MIVEKSFRRRMRGDRQKLNLLFYSANRFSTYPKLEPAVYGRPLRSKDSLILILISTKGALAFWAPFHPQLVAGCTEPLTQGEETR
jgi:hypothetical protein